MFQPDPLASATTGEGEPLGERMHTYSGCGHWGQEVKQAAGSWRRECKGQQIWEGCFYAKETALGKFVSFLRFPELD